MSLFSGVSGNSDTYEREGERLLDDHYGVTNSGGSVSDDGMATIMLLTIKFLISIFFLYR